MYGQSILPSSILKDEPFNEPEPVDRSERRRSRKSVGRRVSFAPTAHVRMFEIPEEKQQTALGQNTFTMPDISSQTGVLGFNLGTISAAEETSMASNESFDVSVRHSDPSESLQDSEGSFAAELGVRNGNVDRGYANILDEDDDDDLDDVDADDDAVTMELTGTMDMGAIDDAEEEEQGNNGIGNHNSNGSGAMYEQSSFDLAGELVDHASGTTTPIGNVDTESLLDMLMQTSTIDQQTSLLDNIISQFGRAQQAGTTDNTMHSHADTDITRVGPLVEDMEEEQNTVVNTGNIVGVNRHSNADSDIESSEDGVGIDNEDAITMELTGIVSRQTGNREEEDARVLNGQDTFYENGGNIQAQLNLLGSGRTPGRFISTREDAVAPILAWSESEPRTIADVLDNVLATSQLGSPIAPFLSHSDPSADRSVDGLMVTTPLAKVTSTPIGASTPNNAATPTKSVTPLRAYTPVVASARRAHADVSTPDSLFACMAHTPVAQETLAPVVTSARRAHADVSTPGSLSARMAHTPIQNPPKARKTNVDDSPALRLASPVAKEPSTPPKPAVFELDSLPPLPSPMVPPATKTALKHSSLCEQAKAGLAVGIFEAYRHQQLTPKALSDSAQRSTFPMKLKPLFCSAKLAARLEYCKALASLFEADHDVSKAAGTEIVSFELPVSLFEEHCRSLQQRKDELALRISKAKQKLAQAAPDKDTGNLASEIRQLRAKQLEIRQERESANSDAEKLNAEIQTLQATSTSLDRQMCEKQSAQSLLLAINGLEPAEVAQDSCDFVYDHFAKLHVGDTAEFASMHPDIDWSAVIARSVGSAERTTRQYTIAVMRANALLKSLLEDVRKVKSHTFVNLQCSDEFQIRVLFFSKKHRRRFQLQIPLDTVECHARLHRETAFDWQTDIVYGALDADRFKACLRACRIDSASPILSIYQHIDASMEAF
ncbi:hypothetical protein H4R24_005235 [Coemansia sp. RSA 988]|nr:hypothetical protein H4R24_005235 [Coemansia sp. RSA 988]